MLFPSLEGYDKKHQSYIIFFRLFLFLLPAKEIRLLKGFIPIALELRDMSFRPIALKLRD